MNIHSVDLYKSMVSYVNELRRCPVLCTVKFNNIANVCVWYINPCGIADHRFPGPAGFTIEVRDAGAVAYVYNRILVTYDHQ